MVNFLGTVMIVCVLFTLSWIVSSRGPESFNTLVVRKLCRQRGRSGDSRRAVVGYLLPMGDGLPAS
jgi:hypothetical protein